MTSLLKTEKLLFTGLIGLIFVACEKEQMNQPTETSNTLIGRLNSQTDDSRSGDQLFSAMGYETLPAMCYRYMSRDVANGNILNSTYASLFTGTSWSSLAKTGTIATDGTNFYGTDYNGNTYYLSATGGTAGPISTTPLLIGINAFVADEIEYCAGSVYAINTGGVLYRINNMNTTTPSLTSVGPLFGSSKFDFNRKSLYRNPATNTLHMVRGDIGTTNTIKHYSINTTTGLATLTNTYSGISFSSNSNISAYHNGTNLYVMVQTIPTGSTYTPTAYTLYSINGAGSISVAGSGTSMLTGDFAYIP